MEKELVCAKNRYVGNAPRKVRLVAGLVRGKNALEAIEMLKFVNKAASLPVKKVLNSAIANATFNKGWDKKQLKVSKITVDEAPSFKRGRAVSRGRYRRILKRNSHITVVLEQISEEKNTETEKGEVKRSEVGKVEMNNDKDRKIDKSKIKTTKSVNKKNGK
ncbi:50S ribosomal protein L22 [Candidatus Dojkabacteria bacterium]|nr:50S ribosomal protein L22 [Candidatus Dojkabacteria bacterium]